MGDTISSLVFRPPKPTPIHPSEYFYLDVDVHSPLCTNKRHNNRTASNNNNNEGGCGDESGNCGGAMMCLDTGESDLASLDASFGLNTNALPANCAGGLPANAGFLNPNRAPSATVPNMRDGQIYKIPAFFIRRRNATQTLLFSHGNAEDLGMMYNRMKDLAMVLGVNIMAYDYTGYGLSIPGPAHGNSSNRSNASGGEGGKGLNEGPSENMIYRNIEAAFHYLTKVRKIPPHQIILYGRSLGSGPSCYLAAKSALNGESVGGLILHSPFLSVYKVVADLNGLDLGLVGDLFHNEKRARNVRCPTLIIHGKEDEVVPFWHAPRLLAAVPPEFRAQPFYVENMGHNQIESRCRDQYIKVVLNFLRMGVWNNRNAGPVSASRTSGEFSSPTVQYRGPSPIPLHERASPSETKENASFYVNQMWIRHAKILLKEVFADVGCSVNNPVQDGNDSRWSSSNSSRGTTSIAASTQSKNSEVDRYSKALSDARDDQDEFAPWKQGNNRRQPASAPSSANVSRYMRQQTPHQITQSDKILTARPALGNQLPKNHGNTNSNSFKRSNTPGYHKAQSMSAVDYRTGQPIVAEEFSISVKSNSPRRRAQQILQQQQQQPTMSTSQRQGVYGNAKSLQLLEGMSRQRRY